MVGHKLYKEGLIVGCPPVKRMVQLLLFPSYKEGCSSISKEEKFLK